jgi:hypothetical protein
MRSPHSDKRENVLQASVKRLVKLWQRKLINRRLLMKKKWAVVPLVIVVLIFAWVVSMAGERVDPTGVLPRLLEIDQTHSDAVQSFLEHLKLDYHPEYGTVKKETLPFHNNDWEKSYVPELFPESRIERIDSITKATFSGTVLTAHKARDGHIFYVWHRYKDETGVFVTIREAGKEKPRTAMAIYKGGNPVYLSSDDLVCRINGHQVSMRMVKW